jgi:hypothetical protein
LAQGVVLVLPIQPQAVLVERRVWEPYKHSVVEVVPAILALMPL